MFFWNYAKKKKKVEIPLIDIVTALHCEAKPLISLFDLKKDPSSTQFDLFRNAEITLIVSGMGKIRSAVATTCVLNNRSEHAAVINFGICGSANAQRKIGDVCVINKVTDHASGREFFPDPIRKIEFPESSLVTFDRPVVTENISGMNLDLVDMEASGFFQAAAMFLGPHRIVCLKIISDFLELSHISKEFISGLVEKNLPYIEKCIRHLQEVSPLPALIFSESEVELLASIRTRLRLTETQFRQLQDWSKSYKVRNQSELAVLRTFLTIDIQTKSDNKHAFDRIRQILIQ